MTKATCAQCGTEFVARTSRQRFCSKPCGKRFHRLSAKICGTSACDNRVIAKGLCSTHYNQRIDPSLRWKRIDVACVICGTLVTRRAGNHGRRPTCSVACRSIVQHGTTAAPRSSESWSKWACERARKHGASVIVPFDRAVVFERDAWRCVECHVQCTEPDPFVTTAATVDHVLSLGRGGPHTLANAQTLCLSCNSSKQDREHARRAA